MKPNSTSGFVSIVLVFVLGLVTLLIGLSLLKTGVAESFISRNTAISTQAFYLANSGIEEAIYQINHQPNYGNPGPVSLDLPFGGGSIKTTVSGTQDEREIESTGIYKDYIRRLKVTVQNTSLEPGFTNAIHAGAGGVELRNQTLISSNDGSGGNIYSNTFIKGAKNSFTPGTGDCKNAASAVDGSVWAVTNIERLNPSDSGICVSKEAHADFLNDCFVKDNLFSPHPPSAQCPSMGTYTVEPAPTPIPLPDMGIETLKEHLNNHGDIHAGDCLADGSGNANDCTGGTGVIGSLIITGNLEKPSNINLAFSGPVWVKGDIIFNSLGTVRPATNVSQISQIILTDGSITSDSNVNYGKNGQAFLMFLSDYNPGVAPDLLCSDAVAPAIAISSNSDSVLFYATHGCIKINANSEFHGAILGEGIRVDNNSVVEYDSGLQSAIFGLTAEGGWQSIKFVEW